MKKLVLIIFSFVSFNIFAAKDSIIIIGGGGEALDAVETQFDGSVEALGEFYQQNKDYKVIVNFNGGHSTTESIIESKFIGAEIKNNFTSKSYEKIISDLVTQLESNQIPTGGKILIFIDSHGSEKDGETHSISTSNSAVLNMNSGGLSMVSLDKLKILSKLAEKKNVKLGIIDGSCHAGNSLKLANSKTCVIAASGPLHYSYPVFASTFAKKMQKNKNLEEIFLETSKEVNGLGFPMISSPIGIIIQNEIYPYLTPYMYYHDDYNGLPLDKIDSYLTNNSASDLICKKNEDFINSNSILNLIEIMSKVNPIDLSQLKKEIASYKKTQDEYFELLTRLDLSNLDKIEDVSTRDKKVRSKYTHREILSTDYSFFIEAKELALKDNSLSLNKRQQLLSLIEFYKECLTTKEKIMRENPHYKVHKIIMDKLKEDENVSRIIAFNIMKEANTAYNNYYKLKEIEDNNYDSKTTNACKDFIL